MSSPTSVRTLAKSEVEHTPSSDLARSSMIWSWLAVVLALGFMLVVVVLLLLLEGREMGKSADAAAVLGLFPVVAPQLLGDSTLSACPPAATAEFKVLEPSECVVVAVADDDDMEVVRTGCVFSFGESLKDGDKSDATAAAASFWANATAALTLILVVLAADEVEVEVEVCSRMKRAPCFESKKEVF